MHSKSPDECRGAFWVRALNAHLDEANWSRRSGRRLTGWVANKENKERQPGPTCRVLAPVGDVRDRLFVCFGRLQVGELL